MSKSVHNKKIIAVTVSAAVLVTVAIIIIFLVSMNASRQNLGDTREDIDIADLVRDNMSLDIETIEQDESGADIATVVVTMPDLGKLMNNAAPGRSDSETSNPDDVIISALRDGRFETIEVTVKVDVSVDGNEKTIDEDAVMDEVLEEQLVKAVNSTVEGQGE